MHPQAQLPPLVQVTVPDAPVTTTMTSDTPAMDIAPISGKRSIEAVTSAFGHLAEEEDDDRPAKRGRQSKYAPHEHGAKKQEQQRLTALFEETVSGDTHESEHTIGYEPLSQTGNLPRGKSTRARELENHAPAYQESKPMHRAHIGTGTTSERDESGMSSHEYRAAQRAMVEAGDVSSAVQLNQLGYAHMPEFQAETGWQKDAADDSYAHMVTGMDQVTYASGKTEQSVSVSPMQQVEMLVARDAARTGQWPDRDALKAAWAQLGYTEDE